jgi:AraC-like DNA-binding protein
MSLMTVIRYFTGNEWMPPAIVLQSQRVPVQHARRAFPRTRFLTGQAETGIIIPASLLSLATTRNYPRRGVAGVPGTESAATGPAWDFPTSLQEIVQTHLDDGYPVITLAADIIGCSVRTLQRRLKQYGLSYTDVVQQARFSLAKDLLSHPGTKVIDTAFAVGYEDPSHFSRAFKRLAGISPNQYRRLNYAH